MSKSNKIQKLKLKLKENELMIEAIDLLIDKQKIVLQSIQKQLLAEKEKFER